MHGFQYDMWVAFSLINSLVVLSMTCAVHTVLIVFIIVVQLSYKMLYCIVNVVTAKEHRSLCAAQCSCIEKSTSRTGTIHFIMCNLIMNILDFTEFCYLFCCFILL